MADSNTQNLTNYTTPLDADVIPIDDVANNTTKKVTIANLKATMTIIPIVRTYLNASSPATWTKPTGLKYVTVEVQAGGGGSASVQSNSGYSRPGAGAGGYSKKTIAAASLGATEIVTIGAGGLGGTGAASDGNDGSASSFGAHATTTGGIKSTTGSSAGGLGGTGASGDINISGQKGGTGISTSNGDGVGGKGGDSVLGFGGNANPNSAGTDGQLYGGGGSGSSDTTSSAKSGGSGAAGIVIVTEYY